jgi:hypothetical protein
MPRGRKGYERESEYRNIIEGYVRKHDGRCGSSEIWKHFQREVRRLHPDTSPSKATLYGCLRELEMLGRLVRDGEYWQISDKYGPVFAWGALRGYGDFKRMERGKRLTDFEKFMLPWLTGKHVSTGNETEEEVKLAYEMKAAVDVGIRRYMVMLDRLSGEKTNAAAGKIVDTFFRDEVDSPQAEFARVLWKEKREGVALSKVLELFLKLWNKT